MPTIADVKYIKVSPGIGIARVGNSPTSFIGPEAPGVTAAPNGGFKDLQGRIKPQAARFRVYGYNENDEAILEILDDSSSGVTLNWVAHLANKKAANYAFQGQFGFDPLVLRNPTVQPGLPPEERTQLHCDPGVQTISGRNAPAVELQAKIFSGISNPGEKNIPFPLGNLLGNYGKKGITYVEYKEADVYLGRLETDDQGRLLVVGGKGDGVSSTDPSTIITKGPNFFTIAPDGTAYKPDTSPGAPSGATIPANLTENWDPSSNLLMSFNPPGWYDDCACGPIHVQVLVAGALKFDTQSPQVFAHSAGGTSTITPEQARGWVGVAPPKYVPSVRNVVSLLDQQLELFPEADPNAGELYLAFSSQGNANVIPWLFNSKTGAAGTFPYQSIGDGTVVPNSGPAITGFQGKIYVAVCNASGNYIASAANASGPFTFTRIGGIATTVSPALTVFNGQLWYAVVQQSATNLNANVYIATSSSNGDFTGATFQAQTLTFTDSEGNTIPGSTTSQSVSLAGYGGVLYVALTGNDNQHYIGNQDQGNSSQIDFMVVGTANEGSDLAPSITVFDGGLYYAYTGLATVDAGERKSYIGRWDNYTSTWPFVYDFEEVAMVDAANVPINTALAPAIAAFNGKLYYLIVSSQQGGPTNQNTAYLGARGPFKYVVDGSGNTVREEEPFSNFFHVGTVNALPPAMTNFVTIDYYRDIFPIFNSVLENAWVDRNAFSGHGPYGNGNFLNNSQYGAALKNPTSVGNPSRLGVFGRLRPAGWITKVPPPPLSFNTGASAFTIPMGTADSEIPLPPDFTTQIPSRMPSMIPVDNAPVPTAMPDLSGNTVPENQIQANNPNLWLSLTRLQLSKIQKWVNGDFVVTGAGPVTPVPLENYPVAQQPRALDFGALDPTVGGGLHPGIEFTWYMEYKEYFCAPFRFAKEVAGDNGMITLTAGSLSGYMSSPWHGDFWSCGAQFWPPQRPNVVLETSASPTVTPPPYSLPAPPNYPPNWFRSSALQIPDDVETNSTYHQGYNPGLFDGNHTVYQTFLKYWTAFGFVTPTGNEVLMETELRESERDPRLDGPAGSFPPPSDASVALSVDGDRYSLYGKVRRGGGGVSGLLVQAYDKDLLLHDKLGETTTNANGEFNISFSKADFSTWKLDQHPDLFFNVYDGKTLLKSTKDQPLRNADATLGDIVIDV